MPLVRTCWIQHCAHYPGPPGPAVALIEEGDNQEDEADILVVTETVPATARVVGQGAEGQGALVRNILQAEKALQACSFLLLSILTVSALSRQLLQQISLGLTPETSIDNIIDCGAPRWALNTTCNHRNIVVQDEQPA